MADYVNVFRDAILALMNGTGGASDINFTHMAFGDGTTPTVGTETQLENEQTRKALTSKSIIADLLQSIGDLTTGEGNGFTINEIGLFADATIAANSGTLVKRIVLTTPPIKTSAVTLRVVSTDKVVIV